MSMALGTKNRFQGDSQPFMLFWWLLVLFGSYVKWQVWSHLLLTNCRDSSTLLRKWKNLSSEYSQLKLLQTGQSGEGKLYIEMSDEEKWDMLVCLLLLPCLLGLPSASAAFC